MATKSIPTAPRRVDIQFEFYLDALRYAIQQKLPNYTIRKLSFKQWEILYVP